MKPQPPGSKPFREGIQFYNSGIYEEALRRWDRASSLGYLEATLRAAELYNEGKERFPRDPVKALRFYKRAAYRSQDALSRYKIGLMYFLGDGVQQSLEHAFTYFQLAANDGYFSAELALANCYYTGQGVEKDFYKAFDIYDKTVHHPKCLVGIARLYHHGHGSFVANAINALNWYRGAAAKEDPDAQYELGCIYNEGSLGVEINYAAAMALFLAAAKHDHVDSVVNIGILHFHGRGTEVNTDIARFHFERALRIDQEHGLANYYVAECLLVDGNGAPEDLILPYLMKAAYSHHSGASFELGKYYQRGTVDKNELEKAITWYQRAVDDGHAYAKDMLSALKPTSTAVVEQHKNTASVTVVEPKPDPPPAGSIENTPVSSPITTTTTTTMSPNIDTSVPSSTTTTAILPSADLKSKPMVQLEEEHKKMRLISLKLKQKLELSEKERLRIEQESKEKDEQIRLLTIEKVKMQQFQMQLILDMADKGDMSNKRKRYTVD
ncbi:hypothetical protein MFLAVUS_003076 [Mucor flavus]|uniref:HCP-like protein n=1 Tax=Mucor flavus TaxID=439312 RepID=A0ABP9YS32_9FUNG